MLNALLDAGSDIGAIDEKSWTPLHHAADTNEIPMVINALLDAGADATASTSFIFGMRAIDLASETLTSRTAVPIRD